MTIHCIGTPTLRLQIACGLLRLGAAGTSHAQFAAPRPPTVHSPVNGTTQGQVAGGTPIKMTWTQRFFSGTHVGAPIAGAARPGPADQ